jgi:hypothetical protein
VLSRLAGRTSVVLLVMTQQSYTAPRPRHSLWSHVVLWLQCRFTATRRHIDRHDRWPLPITLPSLFTFSYVPSP